MKKSKAVTLAFVGSAMLFAGGCGRSPRTLYDQAGNVVPKTAWKNPDGSWKQLYDAKGNLVTQDEIQRAYSSTSSSSTTRSYSTGGWFFGPSWGGGSSYSGGSRSSPSVGGSVSRGGFGSTGGGFSSGG
jgi:YD repeat-containing protein